MDEYLLSWVQVICRRVKVMKSIPTPLLRLLMEEQNGFLGQDPYTVWGASVAEACISLPPVGVRTWLPCSITGQAGAEDAFMSNYLC